MHRVAHNKNAFESRGDRLITHGMTVFSAILGVIGECDVLEFIRTEQGVVLYGKDGRWNLYPIEYKRGSCDSEGGDALQLCGQAMCLEEMFCCTIHTGALYFGETKHRQMIEFSPDLREQVKNSLAEMHELSRKGCTPKAKLKKSCGACSLASLCLPKLDLAGKASEYINRSLEEEC